MTKNRDLKRRVRLRMKKTGEAYTAARLHLVTSAPGPAPTPRAARSLAACVADGDVEGAMIALSLDASPALDAWSIWAALDHLVERLRAGLPEDASPGARLLALLALVHEELGFTVPEEYDDPALDRLHCVLETRRGTPAAIAGLLIILGRRVGLALSPVPFPGHFLVRVEGEQPVFVDPASGGLIPRDGLLDMAAEELGVSRDAAAVVLEPGDTRALVVRLLQNLGRAHRARGDEGHALLTADRLFEVSGAASDRLDRALSLWALGAYEAAREDVERLASDTPDAALLERARARLTVLERSRSQN